MNWIEVSKKLRSKAKAVPMFSYSFLRIHRVLVKIRDHVFMNSDDDAWEIFENEIK